MATIEQIIRRLFPSGTRGDEDGSIGHFPLWPPDLFGAAATIVNLTGSYCRTRYATGSVVSLFGDALHLKEIYRIGNAYGRFRDEHGVVPAELSPATEAEIQVFWEKLIELPSVEVTDVTDEICDAALNLTSIADHASAGIGFITSPRGDVQWSDFVFDEHQYLFSPSTASKRTLKYLPYSLCWRIPFTELCVQPKTVTAQVGCTLRSLSHNLALLPCKSEVETQWMIGLPAPAVDTEVKPPLNLLVVPFPYHINGTCFEAGPACMQPEGECGEGNRRWRFFSMRQKWLEFDGKKITAGDFCDFLVALVHEAEKEVGTVHGIVLPELALDDSLANAVAKLLPKKLRSLELFISGVLDESDSTPCNQVRTYLYFGGRMLTTWSQAKHHRWKLEQFQIGYYNLGDRLDPQCLWWELTDIGERSCTFYVVRQGISLATLICEDLARIDPVQTVIRSIGPNLIVALLMDGAQNEWRWSSRYATVLADDPGSSVLTLTSFGLLPRCASPTMPLSRDVGLWKQPGGAAQKLQLNPGDHGLVLSITHSKIEAFTLDGRSDETMTYKLSLTGINRVRHPTTPKWAEYD